MSINSGTARSRRVMVTALAGVARADGPNEVSDSVTSGRFQIGPERTRHRERGESAHRQARRHDDDPIDLRRLAMGPPAPRLIHEDFDLRPHEFVTFCGGD